MISNLLTPLPMKIAAGVIALLLLCLPVAYFKGRDAGADAVEARYAQAREKALREARRADEAATDQRTRDDIRNRTNDDARNSAIDAAQAGAPDDANRRLACQRLRQAGLAPPPPGC